MLTLLRPSTNSFDGKGQGTGGVEENWQKELFEGKRKT
jgi:hypothetical protein